LPTVTKAVLPDWEVHSRYTTSRDGARAGSRYARGRSLADDLPDELSLPARQPEIVDVNEECDDADEPDAELERLVGGD
jgi:hypothetical protein